MKTILVPTDFSKNAGNALAIAAVLANKVQVKIIPAPIIEQTIVNIASGCLWLPSRKNLIFIPRTLIKINT